ncbi:MAG: hypothetical protein GY822_10410 [Deltaproteobacteria bacterium]|nr:hypothetical protein [Deltaproteobacteria bacterium]
MALLNIDHMAVLQQEGALAVAGEFSVHDEGEHRQPLFVTGLYDDVGNRYMAYDHSMLTGFGLVNPQLLATENYVEDGVVRLLSQFDRGCGYTDDELCIPRRVVTSGSDIIAEHDPSTMPTFGFAALSSDTVLQSTFTEVQRVQENVVETVAVLQGPGRQFYGPPRVSLDGAAHQQTEEGRANCRDRQRRHRAQGKEKREAVTHQGSEKSHAEKRSEKPRKGTIKQKKAEPIVGIAIVVIELKAKKNAKLSLIRVPKNLILP